MTSTTAPEFTRSETKAPTNNWLIQRYYGTPDDLVAALGDPDRTPSGDGKVTMTWSFRHTSGVVLDLRDYCGSTEDNTWSIAGGSGATDEIVQAFALFLNLKVAGLLSGDEPQDVALEPAQALEGLHLEARARLCDLCDLHNKVEDRVVALYAVLPPCGVAQAPDWQGLAEKAGLLLGRVEALLSIARDLADNAQTGIELRKVLQGCFNETGRTSCAGPNLSNVPRSEPVMGTCGVCKQPAEWGTVCDCVAREAESFRLACEPSDDPGEAPCTNCGKKLVGNAIHEDWSPKGWSVWCPICWPEVKAMREAEAAKWTQTFQQRPAPAPLSGPGAAAKYIAALQEMPANTNPKIDWVSPEQARELQAYDTKDRRVLVTGVATPEQLRWLSGGRSSRLIKE
jgi:hypothetical protein